MDLLIPTWINNKLSPFDKLEAHRLGLRHMAVSVFIMQGRKTLIQRRAQTKYHTPGLWANSCCTHPHWGERSHISASRRLKEELGVSDVVLRHCGQVEYRADVGDHLIEHEVVEIYCGEAASDISITPNPDEVMDVRWVDLDDLIQDVRVHPRRFTPWFKIYLEKHIDLIVDTT